MLKVFILTGIMAMLTTKVHTQINGSPSEIVSDTQDAKDVDAETDTPNIAAIFQSLLVTPSASPSPLSSPIQPISYSTTFGSAQLDSSSLLSDAEPESELAVLEQERKSVAPVSETPRFVAVSRVPVPTPIPSPTLNLPALYRSSNLTMLSSDRMDVGPAPEASINTLDPIPNPTTLNKTLSPTPSDTSTPTVPSTTLNPTPNPPPKFQYALIVPSPETLNQVPQVEPEIEVQASSIKVPISTRSLSPQVVENSSSLSASPEIVSSRSPIFRPVPAPVQPSSLQMTQINTVQFVPPLLAPEVEFKPLAVSSDQIANVPRIDERARQEEEFMEEIKDDDAEAEEAEADEQEQKEEKQEKTSAPITELPFDRYIEDIKQRIAEAQGDIGSENEFPLLPQEWLQGLENLGMVQEFGDPEQDVVTLEDLLLSGPINDADMLAEIRNFVDLLELVGLDKEICKIAKYVTVLAPYNDALMRVEMNDPDYLINFLSYHIVLLPPNQLSSGEIIPTLQPDNRLSVTYDPTSGRFTFVQEQNIEDNHGAFVHYLDGIATPLDCNAIFVLVDDNVDPVINTSTK